MIFFQGKSLQALHFRKKWTNKRSPPSLAKYQVNKMDTPPKFNSKSHWKMMILQDDPFFFGLRGELLNLRWVWMMCPINYSIWNFFHYFNSFQDTVFSSHPPGHPPPPLQPSSKSSNTVGWRDVICKAAHGDGLTTKIRLLGSEIMTPNENEEQQPPRDSLPNKNLGLSAFQTLTELKACHIFPAPDNGNHFQYSGHFVWMDTSTFLSLVHITHLPLSQEVHQHVGFEIAWDSSQLFGKKSSEHQHETAAASYYISSFWFWIWEKTLKSYCIRRQNQHP